VSRLPERRAGLVAAATQPLNVAVPTAVVVAGALLGVVWLVLVAVVCWAALTAMTLSEEPPAAATSADPRAFGPAIQARVRDAAAAGAAVRAAIAASPAPLEDVGGEVELLLAAVEADAVRAQRIHAFLAGESPEALRHRVAGEPRAPVRAALEAKLAALDRLQRQLDDLLSEMDHVVATMQTVHAELIAADGLVRRPERDELAEQVSELRMRVRTRAEGLEEAFGESQRLSLP